MSIKVCIGASTIPLLQAGGHVWLYLNWALGLKSLGCEIVWLEQAAPWSSPEQLRRDVELLKTLLAPFGLAEAIAIAPPDEEAASLAQSHRCQDFEMATQADLLLDLGNKISKCHIGKFRRTAFVDVDPGLTQLWIAESRQPPPKYDLYFTIGETVGTTAARFPDGGVRWHYTPPCVYLPEWALATAQVMAPYSTVSSWWGWWETDEGNTYNNEKRTTFLEFLDLPRQTPAKLELALALWGQEDHADVSLLRQHGWRVCNAFTVGATPLDYRNYIGNSRGEFSCAKPSCMRLANAWVSDRSLCYMAMGKPVIVQHTGPSKILPDAEGMFRFRDLQEALCALQAAESDYDYHGRCARRLVEEHFDARKVVRKLLEQAIS